MIRIWNWVRRKAVINRCRACSICTCRIATQYTVALSRQERIVYHDVSANRGSVPDHIERLRTCDGLVLVFPTWWYGMPAILKGWFDRVWVTGVAFTLPPGRGAIRPALHNIRKFGVVTTYGSPWWLVKLVLRDPVRAVLIGGLRRLCARDCRSMFLALYNIDVASRARCEAFRRRVEPGAGSLSWISRVRP